MSEQMLAPEDQMMQWITSKWITKPIYVVSELGIADLMCDGPKNVDALADKTDTHAPALYVFICNLSTITRFHSHYTNNSLDLGYVPAIVLVFRRCRMTKKLFNF